MVPALKEIYGTVQRLPFRLFWLCSFSPQESKTNKKMPMRFLSIGCIFVRSFVKKFCF